jgi:hypothetical protein
MKTAPFFCRGAHVGRPLTQIIQFTSISTYTYKLRTTSFKEKRALHDGKSLRATALF